MISERKVMYIFMSEPVEVRVLDVSWRQRERKLNFGVKIVRVHDFNMSRTFYSAILECHASGHGDVKIPFSFSFSRAN